MFIFRRLTAFFFLLLLGLNMWNIFSGTSSAGFVHLHANLLYSLLFIAYSGISVGMAFLPCSGFHHKVLCHGSTDKKHVSITFDDGPDPLKTPGILRVLEKHDVKAAFFCIGHKIAGNELLLKQMDTNGHLIGNHSFSHSKFFDFFSARKIKAELLETDLSIKAVLGRSPLFFRPPFGVINPMVSNALKNMDLKVICWNIRSLDTLNDHPEKTKRKILNRLKPGSIILLHDHSVFTETYLDDLLAGIREAGFKVVPLDQLMNETAYAS